MEEEHTCKEGPDVLQLLLDAASSEPIKNVAEASEEFLGMLYTLEKNYKEQSTLKASVRAVAAEFRPLHADSKQFVGEMDKFAQDAKSMYLEEFKNAINEGETKRAVMMLQQATAHLKVCSEKMQDLKQKYDAMATKVNSVASNAKDPTETAIDKTIEKRLEKINTRMNQAHQFCTTEIKLSDVI